MNGFLKKLNYMVLPYLKGILINKETRIFIILLFFNSWVKDSNKWYQSSLFGQSGRDIVDFRVFTMSAKLLLEKISFDRVPRICKNIRLTR